MRYPSSSVIAATTIIALAAGSASAQPDLDGSRTLDGDAALYGSPIVEQIAAVIDIVNTQDLNFSAAFNNANVGGVQPVTAEEFVGFPEPNSDPAAVTTGFEIRIPRSQLNAGTSGPIRIAGLLHGGVGGRGFISNQVIGGLVADPGSAPAEDLQPLGDSNDEDTTVDFTDLAGNQFVTANDLGDGETAPTVDGDLDGSYGAPLFVNTLATTLGDNADSTPETAGGSEVNAVYAVADESDVYILITGNTRTNPGFQDFLALFIDGDNGNTGQNTLDSQQAEGQGPGFGILQEFDNLVFDAGFSANYLVSFNGSNDSQFVDAQLIEAGGGGAGVFGGTPSGPGSVIEFDGIDDDAVTVEAAQNNANTVGVAAATGAPAGEFDSQPETVNTGYEFKLDISNLELPGGATEVKVLGVVASSNFDRFANQYTAQVPFDIGLALPPSAFDFSDASVPGDQFISVPVPSTPTSANVTIDGTLDAGQYPALNPASPNPGTFINNTPPEGGVGTNFGNNEDADPITAGGSEINNASFFIAEDPDNNDALTIFGFVGGNLETNANKLLFFFDINTTPGAGQNQVRNDNDDSEFNSNVGGDGFENPASTDPGLTFDAGFEPEIAISYGANADERFADAFFLPGAGNADDNADIAGNIALADQPAGTPIPPIEGSEVTQQIGFGDNDDSSPLAANGSELNNLVATVDEITIFGTTQRFLFLQIGGNLETNNTILELFFDVDPSTGQNTIATNQSPADPDALGNPPVGAFDALNRIGGPFDDPNDNEDPLPGFTFDDGFNADYYFTFNGAGGDGGFTFFGDFARLAGVLPEDPTNPGEPDPGAVTDLGETDGTSGIFTAGDFQVVIDNTNIAGVTGADEPFNGDTSGAASVTTGIEIAIPLGDDIDQLPFDPQNPGDSLKITVFVNGQAHGFVSNQFLGGACVNELGEPRAVDLGDIEGPQFVELVYPGGDGQPFTNSAPASPDCEPPTTSDIPGDADEDGNVVANDLLIVLNNFGIADGTATRSQGDVAINPDTGEIGDGNVVANDLLSVLNNFGTVTNP